MNLFLGNLSWDADNEELLRHFSGFGPIKSVKIMTDSETGKPRGFGFVEFENRVIAMEDNLALANELSQSSLSLYRGGSITALDLLQSFRRELDTANNFLEAYLGWRQALVNIQQLTYYDFEYDMPVMERFGVDVASMSRLQDR